MLLFDNVLLPLGCILGGLLASSGLWLRFFPVFRSIIYPLLSYRIILGVVTGFSGVVVLFFPANGPFIIGSLFPALFGVIIGLLHCLELIASKNELTRDKALMIWIGNVMLYLKNIIGLGAMLLGIYHLFKPETLFF